MNPPTGGPTICPIMPGTSSQDIAETRLRRSTARKRTSRPTGIIIAPPSPWTMRAATRLARFGANAHSTEPPLKTPMAILNTVLAPNRSAAVPLAGMKMARLSR